MWSRTAGTKLTTLSEGLQEAHHESLRSRAPSRRCRRPAAKRALCRELQEETGGGLRGAAQQRKKPAATEEAAPSADDDGDRDDVKQAMKDLDRFGFDHGDDRTDAMWSGPALDPSHCTHAWQPLVGVRSTCRALR